MSTFTLMQRISIAAYVKPRLSQFPKATKILRDNDGECWKNDNDCDVCPFGVVGTYGTFRCCLHFDNDIDAILKRTRIILSDLEVL